MQFRQAGSGSCITKRNHSVLYTQHPLPPAIPALSPPASPKGSRIDSPTAFVGFLARVVAARGKSPPVTQYGAPSRKLPPKAISAGTEREGLG
jgi:hypothetical protein